MEIMQLLCVLRFSRIQPSESAKLSNFEQFTGLKKALREFGKALHVLMLTESYTA